MEYLTPAKLRRMGLGTAFSTDDVALTSLIRIASGLANRACAAPRAHDFRGGTVLNEQHDWDVGNDHIMGQRRIWPYHRPVKAVTRFQIRVTQGGAGVVDFPTAQIYLNGQENYLELVSLSLTTASVYAAGLIPNIGLARPVAELDYTYGWADPITDEELATTSGNTDWFADEQFWSDDPVTVKVAGVAVTSGFTVNRNEGSIHFVSPVVGGDVTASFITRLPNAIAEATALIAADVAAQSRLNQAGLQGLSGLRVLEVEMRQSKSAGLSNVPINPAAAMLLEPYRFRSFA